MAGRRGARRAIERAGVRPGLLSVPRQHSCERRAQPGLRAPRSCSPTTSPRSGRTARPYRLGDGLLRAEGEPGECHVVCFSPRHDLSLGRDGRRRRPARRRRLGRPDGRARAALPLGPGVREPRRGDGRLQPASARPDLGGVGLPATAAREDATQAEHHGADRPPAAARLRGPGDRAASASSTRPSTGWRSSRSGPSGRSSVLVPQRPAARLPDLAGGQRDDLARYPRAGCWPTTTDCSDVPFPYSMGWHQAPFGADAGAATPGAPRPRLPAAAALGDRPQVHGRL